MRVLFTARPLAGHVQPLLPLADALRKRGHEVGFATGPAAIPELRELGYSGFEAGPDRIAMPELIDRFPEFATLPPQEQRGFFFPAVFAGVEALPRATDILEVINAWRPSVLVSEVAELGGPMAAARAKLPHATIGFGPPVQPDVLAATDAVARRLWAAWGVEPATPAGLYDDLYFDPCPPSLQPSEAGTIPNHRQIRTGTGPGLDELAATALNGFPSQGVIYITMGTVYGRDAGLFRELIGGAAPSGRPLVVTSGPHVAPAELTAGGASTLFLPFLPQAAVLPRCDLVITHGGAGSVLGALAFGVPLLIVPRGADHFYNANLVERAGAGRWLAPSDVTAENVRREIQLLLDGSRYRAAAGRVRAEIESMPSPAEAAAVLEELAATGPAGSGSG